MDDGTGQRLALAGIAIAIVFGAIGLLLTIWLAPLWFIAKIALTIFVVGMSVTLAIQQDENQTRRLADWIEHGGYGHSYRAIVGPRLMRLWVRLCDPAPKSAGFPRVLHAALTWRVLDLAMLLAVLYPILALVIVWAITAQAATIGGQTVIEAVPEFGQSHLVSIGVITVWTTVAIMTFRATGRRKHRMARADVLFYVTMGATLMLIWLKLVPATFAIAFAVAFAIAIAFAGAPAVAFAGMFASLFVRSSTFSGFFAAVVALAVASAVQWLDRNERQRLARALLILLLCLLLPIVAATMQWKEVAPLPRALFVFLGLFPLLNALFDALSYAITLALVRRGLRLKSLPAFALGLLDLVIAGILFFALGATLVAAMAGLNALADVPIIDIGSLLADVAAGWSPASAWAYLMVLSTLVPTLLHLALTLLSLERAALPGLRAPFARMLRRGGWLMPFTALAGGLACVLPVAILYGLGWVAWHYLGPTLETYGDTYMQCLLNLATWIQAI